MTSKIKLRYQDNLSATKEFLDSYLEQKNNGVETKYYLSFYLSEDNASTHMSRGVRIARMMREVELTLKSQLKTKDAASILSQITKLNVSEIIRDNTMSVAFFASNDFAGFVFIPFPVFENVIVAHSLHLKPILPWILSGDQFYLITLSSNVCRLLKGDSFSLKEVTSVALNKTEESVSDKKSKQKFLMKAEAEFYKYVKDDSFPIILGGVEELHNMYQGLNRDADLINERIAGNLNKTSYEELHEDCLGILNTIKKRNEQALLNAYVEMRPYGKVLEKLNEITIAAIQGRIRNLMIPSDRFMWGNLNKSTGQIYQGISKNLAMPQDDIFDDLAEIVIARGGEVTLFKGKDMPADKEAIAILR